MIWTIEIVDWKFMDMDWNDEFLWIICVVNCNELICLNGWLRCGKPREKMRLKAYAELWDENWAMWNCTKWLNWKRCPKKEKNELKKMPRKGKEWNKKDTQNGKRLCWERWKMVYLSLTFLFRQLN